MVALSRALTPVAFSSGSWVFGSPGRSWGVTGVVVSLVRLRLLLSTATPVDEERFAAPIELARRNVGLDSFPRLGTSNRIATPVAVGFIRDGRVLLPAGCLERMSADQLAHVLTHEGAHVARRDPLLRLVQRLSLALWWWHPMVHVMNKQLSRAREELCDNVVLSRVDAVDYGSTLLECGRWLTSRSRSELAVGLFGSHERLEHRIQKLLNPRRDTMNHTRQWTLLGAGLATATTTILAGATQLTIDEQAARPNVAASDRTDVADVDHRSLTREITLAFADASTPGHLDVDIKRGSIKVTGHDGADVIVRLTVPEFRPAPDTGTEGLHPVRATPLDFDIRQSGNTIELDSNSSRYVTNLEITVPYLTNLTLDSYMEGVLEVTGVSGTIAARSQHNDITLTDVSGTADVYSYNGNFVASFVSVTGGLCFETYNGSVDLTLPMNIETTMRVQTSRGVMRTDFTIAQREETLHSTAGGTGTRALAFDDFVVGDINGGGSTCTIETTNGDILLRQGETTAQ